MFHVEQQQRSVLKRKNSEPELRPTPLGPLEGCPIQKKHFASDCNYCKRLWHKFLDEREAAIEANRAKIAPQESSPGIPEQGDF
jgi:hypothetical protein